LAFDCDIYRVFLTAFATHQNDTSNVKIKRKLQNKVKPHFMTNLPYENIEFQEGTKCHFEGGSQNFMNNFTVRSSVCDDPDGP